MELEKGGAIKLGSRDTFASETGAVVLLEEGSIE